jgi:hypothetical protein
MCSGLSKILIAFQPVITYHSHILSLITRLANFIIDKYLTNYELADLTNISIIKLINTLLIDGYSAEL